MEVLLKLRVENGDVHRVTLRADRGEANYAGLVARVIGIAGESTPPWYFAYYDGDDLIAIASEPDFAEATRGRGVGDAPPLELIVIGHAADHGPPPPFEAAVDPNGNFAAVVPAGSGAAGAPPPDPRHHPVEFLDHTVRVAAEPFVQMARVFAGELGPAAHRAWATCGRMGLTSTGGWERRLRGYTFPQRVALGGIAVVGVAWPLATIARASLRLARPLVFIAWNIALLRLAFVLIQRVASAPSAPPRPRRARPNDVHD